MVHVVKRADSWVKIHYSMCTILAKFDEWMSMNVHVRKWYLVVLYHCQFWPSMVLEAEVYGTNEYLYHRNRSYYDCLLLTLDCMLNEYVKLGRTTLSDRLVNGRFRQMGWTRLLCSYNVNSFPWVGEHTWEVNGEANNFKMELFIDIHEGSSGC